MFKMEFEVRDNEVDIQGVVNNANYFIYMAHARHKFLHSIGIDFAEMARNKQNLFLVSTNLEFKRSLVPNDKFYVTCELIKEGSVRFAFEQKIYRSNDDTLIAKAHNIGACIDGNTKRPYVPEQLKTHFKLD